MYLAEEDSQELSVVSYVVLEVRQSLQEKIIKTKGFDRMHTISLTKIQGKYTQLRQLHIKDGFKSVQE